MNKAQEIKTISKDALHEKIRKNKTFELVNVLGPEDYPLGVIKGSKLIPLAELEDRCGELDKSKEIVTYCAGPDCDASRKAAQLLAEKGYRVSAYEGGIKEWKAANLPVETEEAVIRPEETEV